MAYHRFFLEDGIDGVSEPVVLPLSPEDAHHAISVLRLRAGELVDVVEPDGGCWRVRIVSLEDGVVTAERVEALAPASRLSVTLVQGVAKGDKMDEIVRHAVELGASAIVPVRFARSVVKFDAEKAAQRTQRWQRIAKSAAEQSQRAEVPLVHEVVSAADVVELVRTFDRTVVLWEEAGEGPSMEAALAGIRADSRVALVIGPEGGLTAEEVASLEAAGAVTCSLGPYILRTETASLAALAVVGWLLRGRADTP